MKRLISVASCLAFLALTACLQAPQQDGANAPQSAVAVKNSTQTLDLKPLASSGSFQASLNQAIVEAFQRKQSHVWVEGSGVVTKLLADDNNGARHQRFLVNINPQQTLLFAHNIDLAPRIAALNIGDTVEFRGEYIFNPKGGIVHWTHRDPKHPAQGGWIQYQGNRYE